MKNIIILVLLSILLVLVFYSYNNIYNTFPVKPKNILNF